MCGFPLTRGRVRQLAYQFAHTNGLKGFSEKLQMAGKKWVKGFLKRHSEITVKTAKNLSVARAMGANPTVIADWYKKFKLTAKACGVTTPGQVWSGDETSVQTVPKEKKVLAVRKKLHTSKSVQRREKPLQFSLLLVGLEMWFHQW